MTPAPQPGGWPTLSLRLILTMVAPPFAVFEGWARVALPPSAPQPFPSLSELPALVHLPAPARIAPSHSRDNCSIATAPAPTPDPASPDCGACSAASPAVSSGSRLRNRKKRRCHTPTSCSQKACCAGCICRRCSLRNQRAKRCFSTCNTIDGSPRSGSPTSRCTCFGMTTYPTTTKRRRGRTCSRISRKRSRRCGVPRTGLRWQQLKVTKWR